MVAGSGEPQIVADQRAAGSYEFLQSLPAPRSMMAMAWYTVALITALTTAWVIGRRR